MIDLIGALFEQLGLAAIDQLAMVPILNDGPPARFVAIDPDTGMVVAAVVATGETVRVNRSWRLLVERFDTTKIRSLCAVHRSWRTM